ncbi:hypothetical protein NPIL_652461 [Nephila pilipes]|uniref:Uncharacterized protein n=1 Tax=Nephila pilipes TaxID=299642 RepID=A0A8X6PQQ1_NEPPI|nr:hypothetical protein NPIL_652461 [Nephila pilipes]
MIFTKKDRCHVPRQLANFTFESPERRNGSSYFVLLSFHKFFGMRIAITSLGQGNEIVCSEKRGGELFQRTKLFEGSSSVKRKIIYEISRRSVKE